MSSKPGGTFAILLFGFSFLLGAVGYGLYNNLTDESSNESAAESSYHSILQTANTVETSDYNANHRIGAEAEHKLFTVAVGKTAEECEIIEKLVFQKRSISAKYSIMPSGECSLKTSGVLTAISITGDQQHTLVDDCLKLKQTLDTNEGALFHGLKFEFVTINEELFCHVTTRETPTLTVDKTPALKDCNRSAQIFHRCDR